MFKRCKHENRRCIHGDEILGTLRIFGKHKIARVRCADCWKPLYNGRLLLICSYTGQRHQKWRQPTDQTIVMPRVR